MQDLRRLHLRRPPSTFPCSIWFPAVYRAARRGRTTIACDTWWLKLDFVGCTTSFMASYILSCFRIRDKVVLKNPVHTVRFSRCTKKQQLTCIICTHPPQLLPLTVISDNKVSCSLVRYRLCRALVHLLMYTAADTDSLRTLFTGATILIYVYRAH